MTLRQLKLLTILAPFAFIVALDVARHLLLPTPDLSAIDLLVTACIALIASALFSELVFSVISRMQDHVNQRNRELLALHEAGLDVFRELGLETVLQRVVDRARALVGSRYGALLLLRQAGGVEWFLTSGISAEERQRLGPLPRGHGLLGAVLDDPRTIRLPDLTKDPRSVGFPPNHPSMHSLLAVPIMRGTTVLGGLYVTEKIDRPEFSEDDAATIERFAVIAALAIENARLHGLAREAAIAEERDRIAREMHDSLAQVLGYVNTKAQAAEELLRKGQTDRALSQIAQLGQAARDSYADVRESILGLRTTLGPERSLLEALSEFLARWEEQSGVHVTLEPHVDRARLGELSGVAELQLLRIIQEALANVRKHARAANATVILRTSDGMLEAEILDDGVGFTLDAPGKSNFPRFGLSTMRERATAVGGDVEVESVPAKGTTVRVRMPLDHHAGQGEDRASADRR